jgi:hypothetical protein
MVEDISLSNPAYVEITETKNSPLIFSRKCPVFSAIPLKYQWIYSSRVKDMGYYDFDDHFWSPREVCAQAPTKDTQEPFWRVPKLVSSIFRKVFGRRDGIEQS